ncbi:MAG TPA: hypothetical protein VFA26_09765, partial [Gemmataceae bacterium]|nr:hypothetical protein [Gemmataceae bacterium]
MRKNLLLAAVCLALPAPAPAADRDKALAVIDQAIKAHGGAGALAKTQVVVRSGRGTMHVGGQEVPFADEFSASLPGRLRLVVEVGPGKPT